MIVLHIEFFELIDFDKVLLGILDSSRDFVWMCSIMEVVAIVNKNYFLISKIFHFGWSSCSD